MDEKKTFFLLRAVGSRTTLSYHANRGVGSLKSFKSACSQITCTLACPNGFEKDTKGCPICKCLWEDIFSFCSTQFDVYSVVDFKPKIEQKRSFFFFFSLHVHKYDAPHNVRMVIRKMQMVVKHVNVIQHQQQNLEILKLMIVL